MLNIIRKAANSKFLNYIFPRHCMLCRKTMPIEYNEHICSECKKYFDIYNGQRCRICGRPIHHYGDCEICNSLKLSFDKGYCVYSYKGNIRKVILRLKFNNSPLYCNYLAQKMAEYIGDNIYSYDYITAVPMHYTKKFIRGYNQAEELALKLSELTGIKYYDSLVRFRYTLPQSQVAYKDRHKNIKGAFQAKNIPIRNKKILLIDDILTTASTVNECSKVLKQNGAEKVDIFILAGVEKN